MLLPLVLALASSSPTLAGSDILDAAEEAAWHLEREQRAAESFDNIMRDNYAEPIQAAPRLMPAADAVSESMTIEIPPAGAGAPRAEVPLDRWEAAQDALTAMSRDGSAGPLVVLGASSYRGEALPDGSALRLHLTLDVTLSGEDAWKTVPLVGERVVVVDATADGKPLPLSSRDGYHVWVTDGVGERRLELDLLVPGSGRRGSLEYELQVARTPVTKVQCDFAAEGLEPRLRGTVQSSVASRAGHTRLDAVLAPTSRIHLVGFKDLGEDSGREARVYAETLGLLSVEEESHELFAVVRYNILYAGQRTFDLRIPAGWTVVDADGEGAFRYVLDDQGDEGALLRGETAFPIRSRYEISLRLRRDAADSGDSFDVALPQAIGAERQYGWLGVEVPGTLQLEEEGRDQAAAVDVRQLPFEVVQSAVSPVLRAWRVHSPDASVRLQATRLPDVEPASASIDRVIADTVLSEEGRLLTDVRVTLRNRLRHSLAIRLPDGVEVRSALLSGEPVKPGRSDDGTLRFPLERSREGAGGLEPFTLQLVLEQDGDAMGLFGRKALELPAFELPVSSLRWTVWAPAKHHYTALKGEVDAQTVYRSGEWYQPPAAGLGTFDGNGDGFTVGELAGAGSSGSSETGAMPVRIELPKTGRSMATARYWVAADRSVTASTWYWQGWLETPARGILWLVGIVGGAALLWRKGWVPRPARFAPALKAWWARRKDGEPDDFAWTARNPLAKVVLVMGGCGAGFLLFIATVRWLTLLDSPL
ncbi:MAG: hypothetical protein H6742_16340 [Alphaproteobacteria bacterium]|nr:hypothetical protein [Alphaproteobacteria bacterium]